MDLHELQLQSNAKLQAALDKIVVLSTTNNLYIKDITQNFSVTSSIDLIKEKSFVNQINKMRDGHPPQYKIELVLHMGRFESPKSNSNLLLDRPLSPLIPALIRRPGLPKWTR